MQVIWPITDVLLIHILQLICLCTFPVQLTCSNWRSPLYVHVCTAGNEPNHPISSGILLLMIEDECWAEREYKPPFLPRVLKGHPALYGLHKHILCTYTERRWALPTSTSIFICIVGIPLGSLMELFT
ncbi:hypothetical protein BGX38DRAFT_1217453, partial [Terfezia claveryi]